MNKPPESMPAPGDPDIRLLAGRLSALLEDRGAICFETDLSGRFQFASPGFLQLLDQPERLVIGKKFIDFMDGAAAGVAKRRLDTVYDSGRARSGLIWEWVGRDRARVTVELTLHPIRSDRGVISGFRGAGRELSGAFRPEDDPDACAVERFRADTRAENRYRAFLDFLPDPVFVFHLDGKVSYVNPAFERVFGWSLEEIEGKKVPFVPEDLKEQTRRGYEQLFREGVVLGHEVKRLTRDGRVLDIQLSAAVFYDEDGAPAGQVAVLRDVTRERRAERNMQALFRISRMLHQYPSLDELFVVITREVKDLMGSEGAMVVMLDEEAREFFFRTADVQDREAGRRIGEIRFPIDKGISGYILRTGQPMIVNDPPSCPWFITMVDEQSGYETRNLADVPIRNKDRFIGVLSAVNKKNGVFTEPDLALLETVADIVAPSLENARIIDELNRSYESVKSLNQAKERVIHHLSHELKTPVSVLSVSVNLLKRKLGDHPDPGVSRVLDRAQRNLDRILEMQYEIEDILRERDFTTRHLLSGLLEACADQIELLAAETLNAPNAMEAIQARIEELFGPRDRQASLIRLDRFLPDVLDKLAPRFAHRNVPVIRELAEVPEILIPGDVLHIIVEGLVRNAVEATPDGAKVTVSIASGPDTVILTVRDFGIGISEEHQKLLFEGGLSTQETIRYATRNPFDFNAGGRGFDLLRMKIFSERHRFSIDLASTRCPHLEGGAECPGDITACEHCRTGPSCHESCGTTVSVRFRAVERI